jgi:hypothetical protein
MAVLSAKTRSRYPSNEKARHPPLAASSTAASAGGWASAAPAASTTVVSGALASRPWIVQAPLSPVAPVAHSSMHSPVAPGTWNAHWQLTKHSVVHVVLHSGPASTVARGGGGFEPQAAKASAAIVAGKERRRIFTARAFHEIRVTATRMDKRWYDLARAAG